MMITRSMDLIAPFLFILFTICSAAKLPKFPEEQSSDTGILPQTTDNIKLPGRGLFLDYDLPDPVIPDDYVIKEPLEPEFRAGSMDDVVYNNINRRESDEDAEDSKFIDEDKIHEVDGNIPILDNDDEVDEEHMNEDDEEHMNEDDEKHGEEIDEEHVDENDEKPEEKSGEEHAKEDGEKHKEESDEKHVDEDDGKHSDEDDKDNDFDKEQSEEVGKDFQEGNKTDEGVPNIDEGLIFESPFFNLEQMMRYLNKLERAMEQIFRQTVDEINLLNGTYVNSTEEEMEIDGRKYKVNKSIMKAGDNNSSIFIEAVQSVSESHRKKRSNWYSEDAETASDTDP